MLKYKIITEAFSRLVSIVVSYSFLVFAKTACPYFTIIS